MLPIIGIDPSLTGTGVARWTPGAGVEVDSFTSDTKHGGGGSSNRWRYIVGHVFEWLLPVSMADLDAPGIVVMEGLPLGTVTGNVIDLASLRAVLAYGLTARGYILVDHLRKSKRKGDKTVQGADPTGRGISPTSLKLFALGKGGGTGTDKDAMVIAAKDRFGVMFRNNNEADALWLMELGRCHYDPLVTPPTGRSVEVLETIDWPTQ